MQSTAGAWVISEASDSLYQLTLDPASGQLVASEISHPELIAPQAIDVDDSGRVFISSGGSILEFEPPEDREWVLAADPIFPDVAAGRFLQIARSHDNYLAEIYDQESWYHVPPMSIPEPGAVVMISLGFGFLALGRGTRMA